MTRALAAPDLNRVPFVHLKRWLGQELTQRLKGEPGCPQPGTNATWWAECGSIRWIFEEDSPYYDNAIAYVNRQRATPA